MSKIIFYPKNELVKNVIPAPKPITIPEWFKKVPQFEKIDGFPVNKLIVQNAQVNTSAKHCMPFMDSFRSGYAFSLWADIQVRQTDSGPIINWAHSEKSLIEVNVRANPNFPVWQGFDPLIFSWISNWGIKTPKGYSCLFTHPFNRTDLPFVTTTGIMDTDEWGIWGNQPFSLKTGFEGVIEAGTPIIHVFPFKRENWKSEINDSLTDWGNYENLRRASKFSGYYKNKYWKRKNYE
jgi:hypothetical protein